MKKEVYSLFNIEDFNNNEENNNQIIKIKSHNKIYNMFLAKRNASKIDQYFFKNNQFRKKFLYIFCSIMLIVSIIIYFLTKINTIFYDSLTENSISLINTFQNEIKVYINQFFIETLFFNKLFINLFKKNFNLNISNLIKLMILSQNLSSNYIKSWNLGYNSGEYYSIGHYNSINYFKYGNTTNNSLYYLNINNISIPLNGIYLNNFNLFSKDFYNNNNWSTISTELNFNNPFLTIFYTNLIYNINNTFIGKFSQSLNLNYLQELLLLKIPTPKSSFSLITDSNILITLTGTEKPYDIFNQSIIFKEIQEVEDLIWICLTKNNNFKFKNSFHLDCNINNKVENFYFSSIKIPLINSFNWDFYFLLNINDIIGYIDDKFNPNILLFIILILLISAVFLISFWYFQKGFYFSTKSFLKNFNNNLFKKFVFLFLFKNLNILINNSKFENIVTKTLLSVLMEIQQSSTTLYIHHIPRFRDSKLISVENLLLKFHGFYYSFKIPLKKENKKLYQFNRSYNFNSNKEDFFLILNSFINKLNSENHFITSKLINIFEIQLNNNPQILIYFIDSISFLNVLFQKTPFYNIFDNFISLILLISCLSWHLSMNNRNFKKKLIEKYFLINYNIINEESIKLLKQLSNCRSPEFLVDSIKWDFFCDSVLELSMNSIISKHFYISNQTELILKFYKNRKGIFYSESLIIASFLLNLSQISFFFPMENIDLFRLNIHEEDLLNNFEKIIEFEEFIYQNIIHNSNIIQKLKIDTRK